MYMIWTPDLASSKLTPQPSELFYLLCYNMKWCIFIVIRSGLCFATICYIVHVHVYVIYVGYSFPLELSLSTLHVNSTMSSLVVRRVSRGPKVTLDLVKFATQVLIRDPKLGPSLAFVSIRCMASGLAYAL